MTVEIGSQGGKFQEEVMEKIDELRSLGYSGVVSVDGGVNLNTAKFIKNHNINRVSVGSYFSKSNDIKLARMKLELALNMP